MVHNGLFFLRVVRNNFHLSQDVQLASYCFDSQFHYIFLMCTAFMIFIDIRLFFIFIMSPLTTHTLSCFLRWTSKKQIQSKLYNRWFKLRCLRMGMGESRGPWNYFLNIHYIFLEKVHNFPKINKGICDPILWFYFEECQKLCWFIYLWFLYRLIYL